MLRDADWREEIAPGVIVGERARPIASAAIYVPCGKGSFPSVMAHLGVPAAVAGVPQVVVLCPPLRSTGRVDPAYLYIAAQLGLREVWRVNGPSGIAAAALGSASIPRVRKIVGPGSPAVTVAQLLAVEHGVATNMLQGPSESLIIADDSADPVLLALRPADRGRARLRLGGDAADVERGAGRGGGRGRRAAPGGAAAGPARARDGRAQRPRRHPDLPRTRPRPAPSPTTTRSSTSRSPPPIPRPRSRASTYAAEILIGQHTPMAAANFTIGVPNTLPSGGYAAVSSGITARTFLATSSTAELSADGLAAVGPAARVIAEYERFPAHAGRTRGAWTVSEPGHRSR